MYRMLSALLALALINAVPTFAQGRAAFTVGTAKAARGQKATGVIEVPPGSDAGTNIAVAVVHGSKPGPVLALVAAAHGTEYTSIIAAEQLDGMLEQAAVTAAFRSVPLVTGA